MGHYHDSARQPDFKHISFAERAKIESYRKAGWGCRQIARDLGRSPSSISREIKLGSASQTKAGKTQPEYFSDTAERRARERRKASSNAPGSDSPFVKAVDKTLRECDYKCGVDPIVHKLQASGDYSESEMRSTRTIYRYIKEGRMKAKPKKMLRMGRLRPRRKAAEPPQNKRVLGESIEKRPAEAESRETFGHWECDLIIGSKSGGDDVLLTLHERMSRFTIAKRVASKSAADVEAAIREEIERYGMAAFKTLTLDNGSEFASMGKERWVYYCHPYSSWEKGGIECHNAMVRRFVPKGTRIDSYTNAQIQRAEEFINALLRKVLGYRSPESVFDDELDKLYRAE